MKVLMLSKACHVAAYRRKLEEMATLGLELTLIVPPYWGLGKNRSFFEKGHTQGYDLIVENPVLNGHFHWHFYPHLAKHLERVRPDLVHIDEEPNDLVTFHALRASRRFGARTLFFTWQNIFHRFPPPFNFFEGHTLAHADGGIAGNSDAAQILRRKGFAKPLFLIPQFGVDPELYRPESAEKRAPGHPFCIGYVGRLVEEKGILILLQAAARLQGEWRLELVGDGPLKRPMMRLAQRLGIEPRLELRGVVPSTQIPHYLSRFDALVLPSLTRPRWREQFGRVLIEAMACGVPVIGSDSGEIPRVIADAGLICREGEVTDLAAQLSRLMQDPPLWADLRQRGRERVEAFFTQKRIAEETVAAYKAILNDQGGNSPQLAKKGPVA